MLLESKRLMELAGIKSDEPNVLTESVAVESDEKESDVRVSEADECKEDVMENEEEIREAVRKELDRMWASGEVFGKRAKNVPGHITMGFAGVGFKK